MTRALFVAGLAALALAGCNTTNRSLPVASAEHTDYVAVASTHSEPTGGHNGLDAKVAHYAQKYDVPESLIHRSIRRESNYNPGARNGPYWGLMQIRHDTARGMGYQGGPHGLLDADTNLNYAVPYLANAWRLSGGSEARAIALYAGGYYYVAKRRHMLDQMISAAR